MAEGLNVVPRFRRGDWVRVRVSSPPGHYRTPGYIQGKRGRVEAIHGTFGNPESLAYGGDGLPKRTLYLVRFPMDRVWDDGSLAGNRNLVDLYEHWLDPSPEATDD